MALKNEIEKELLLREASRRWLLPFIKYTFIGSYLENWVHEVLCKKLEQFLQDVIDKKSPRLMVMMPPRHGKSEIVSRRFPAWCFGKYPDINFICSSYSAALAKRFNKDVQRIMDSTPYQKVFGNVRLPNKSQNYTRTSELFEIVDYGGSFRSAGVGGGITGMGCEILSIDDPVKDRKDADSATIRETISDWYSSTAYTRLAPGGGVLLTMTRWHADDLAGRLLEDMAANTGDHWDVLRFPAIAEQDEEFRKQGEALHESRYNLERLEQIKKALPDRDWVSLYQQTPMAEGGNIFRQEWFRYYTPAMLPDRFDSMCQSWDMTFKDDKDSDFVVGQVWGRKGGDFFLLDQIRGRMDFVKTVENVVALTNRWPKVRKKLIEEKANGAAVISALQKSVFGMEAINPEESKLARAYSVTPLWQSGNVYVPDPSIAPWIVPYRRELIQFPNGANDDQVDATSQALNYLADKRGVLWQKIL